MSAPDLGEENPSRGKQCDAGSVDAIARYVCGHFLCAADDCSCEPGSAAFEHAAAEELRTLAAALDLKAKVDAAGVPDPVGGAKLP